MQYDENGDPINQVHHFVGFIIIALQVPEEIKSFSVFEATVLDGLPNSINQQDIDLAILAIWIAWHIRNGVITWKDLPEWVYDGIKS